MFYLQRNTPAARAMWAPVPVPMLAMPGVSWTPPARPCPVPPVWSGPKHAAPGPLCRARHTLAGFAVSVLRPVVALSATLSAYLGSPKVTAWGGAS